MEKDPDIATLAQKILDLWQDYLSSLATNPDLSQEVTQLLALWNHQSQGAIHADKFPFPPFAFGAKAASPASDAGVAALEQIRDRMAALEERFAGLEKILAGRPSPSARRNKRTKPARKSRGSR